MAAISCTISSSCLNGCTRLHSAVSSSHVYILADDHRNQSFLFSGPQAITGRRTSGYCMQGDTRPLQAGGSPAITGRGQPCHCRQGVARPLQAMGNPAITCRGRPLITCRGRTPITGKASRLGEVKVPNTGSGLLSVNKNLVCCCKNRSLSANRYCNQYINQLIDPQYSCKLSVIKPKKY